MKDMHRMVDTGIDLNKIASVVVELDEAIVVTDYFEEWPRCSNTLLFQQLKEPGNVSILVRQGESSISQFGTSRKLVGNKATGVVLCGVGFTGL